MSVARSEPLLTEGQRPVSRVGELWRGARDSLPLLLGAAPFGLIFGSLAVSSGLSSTAAVAMSLLVFAGSSQFIAVTLLASSAGTVVVILTTLVVNLRHALYSASLRPHVARLPHRWRVPLAFFLTDETFAIVQHRYDLADDSRHKHWYYLGSCLAMYSNWLLWTVCGVCLGHAISGIENLGLEFAMAATFIGIVVPLLRTRPMLSSALAAAAVALLARELPYKLGLILASVAGVAVAVWAEGKEAANKPA